MRARHYECKVKYAFSGVPLQALNTLLTLEVSVAQVYCTAQGMVNKAEQSRAEKRERWHAYVGEDEAFLGVFGSVVFAAAEELAFDEV